MSITVFDLDFWPNKDYGIKLLIGNTETFNFGVSSLAKQNFSNSIDLKFKLRFRTLPDWFKIAMHLCRVSSQCKHKIRPVTPPKNYLGIFQHLSFGRKHPELNISPMILNIVFQLAKDSMVITLH
jgi:hypothetical protein